MNRFADSHPDLSDRQTHARYIARWEVPNRDTAATLLGGEDGVRLNRLAAV